MPPRTRRRTARTRRLPRGARTAQDVVVGLYQPDEAVGLHGRVSMMMGTLNFAAQCSAHVEAVQAGQVEVEDDDVRARGGRRPGRPGPSPAVMTRKPPFSR
ncbi:MAG: hypothetical protein U0641_14350 [Anaerolineae bacterium]